MVRGGRVAGVGGLNRVGGEQVNPVHSRDRVSRVCMEPEENVGPEREPFAVLRWPECVQTAIHFLRLLR